MPKMVFVSRRVWLDGGFSPAAVFVEDGKITRIEKGYGDSVSHPAFADGFVCRDFGDCAVFPGFTDVHVHFREPGFLYKETIRSGSMAAAHGGYTTVCTMPNLQPVPDSPDFFSPRGIKICSKVTSPERTYALSATGKAIDSIRRNTSDISAPCPLSGAPAIWRRRSSR